MTSVSGHNFYGMRARECGRSVGIVRLLTTSHGVLANVYLDCGNMSGSSVPMQSGIKSKCVS
jgi:hypothetical protein